jgi:hypothetical protein
MRQRGWDVLAGLALGAGFMYFMDPTGGRRRRALARDRTVALAHDAQRVIGKTARDVAHRVQGVVSEAGGRADHPSDDVLVERVRSAMGRYVSHPHAIEVEAGQGRVTLRGQILAPEVRRLLRVVRSVPGVHEIDNRLQVHRRPGRVPSLQGGVTRTGPRPELLQRRWSPTARLLTGVAGSSLLLYGIRRGRSGVPMSIAGAAMLARGLELRWAPWVGAMRRRAFEMMHRSPTEVPTVPFESAPSDATRSREDIAIR